MRGELAGLLAGAALLAVVPLTPWPESWPLFVMLALSAVFLERAGVQLDGEFRFSPAVPMYLACGMVEKVGCAGAAVLLLTETVSRRPSAALPALESRAPLVAGVVGMGLGRWLLPDEAWLPAIVGPALYLLGSLALEHQTRRRLDRSDRLRWIKARLQIRPLQLILGISSLAVWQLAQQQIWGPLLMVPVLSAAGWAAENIVLKAQEVSAQEVLDELDQARGRSERTARKLAEVETQKQLMEGFSAHLARSPGIQETAQSLVATVTKLVEVDDVAVFLRTPTSNEYPEPFFYRCQEPHQARLQGAALTGLREPLLDQCWKAGEMRTATNSSPSADRLFDGNRSGLAVPLGELGMLYLGRQQAETFPKPELRTVLWLAEKATLGFRAAFRHQDERRKSARQRRQVAELNKRVALLASLIRCAEEMAATLELEQLADRLRDLLQQTMPHDEGFLTFEWDQQVRVRRNWGTAGPPSDLSVVAAVRESGQGLLVEDAREAGRIVAPKPEMTSFICAPLRARDRICGAVCLGANVAGGFTREDLDQLRLISYQAGMAFSNARLFHQVVQARRDLEESQQRLVQSRKMSAIGELAAGVAHELNTPLGVISLSLESAQELMEASPAAARRMLEKALKAVERSQSITGRLLSYSRRPDQSAEEVSLPDLVQAALELLSFEMRESGIEPEIELAQAKVMGRPQELQGVLINLIRNAGQAMEGLTPEQRGLKIRTFSKDELAYLEVVDRGPGMSAELQERIFEPFFTTKEVGKGTGLGLWVALQTAEQHQGTLEVESAVGKGTTFRLVLPTA